MVVPVHRTQMSPVPGIISRKEKVVKSLVLCFVDRFVLLGIVLSVLQFLDSDYPFVIFKLFFQWDDDERTHVLDQHA
jgi:hypothetical protein